MKLYRMVAVILGSLLFMPISCTVGIIGGTSIVAWLDSRDVERGDTVHALFSAVAENREKIQVLGLSQIEDGSYLKEGVSFIMSKSNGGLITDQSEYTYTVLEENDNYQIIEVVERYLDGDNTIWSRYRSTENNIFPLTSRMFYFGYMFNAILIGFVFSVTVFISGKFLKGHSEKLKNQKGAS